MSFVVAAVCAAGWAAGSPPDTATWGIPVHAEAVPQIWVPAPPGVPVSSGGGRINVLGGMIVSAQGEVLE